MELGGTLSNNVESTELPKNLNYLSMVHYGQHLLYNTFIVA